MWRLRLSSGLIAALALAVPAAAAPAPLRPECAAPEEILVPDEPLDQVAAAIAAGGPLRVLAIGSATTVGEGSTNPKNAAPGSAFPYRLADALRAALPNVPVELAVRGGRGMTAEAMLPLLKEALKQQRYQLVLWQTGTVEAVHGLRPDGLLSALQDGAELVREANADLVLIDPQFSRFLRANADLPPYETTMEQVATMPGVVLFHRFELMRAWAHDGQIDLERTAKADRDKTFALLNSCLGDALARFVLNGATPGQD